MKPLSDYIIYDGIEGETTVPVDKLKEALKEFLDWTKAKHTAFEKAREIFGEPLI